MPNFDSELYHYLLRQGIGQSFVLTGSTDLLANTRTEIVLEPDDGSDTDIYFQIAAEETLGNTGAQLSVTAPTIQFPLQPFPAQVWSNGIPIYAEITKASELRLILTAAANAVSITYSVLAIRVHSDRIKLYRKVKDAWDRRIYSPPPPPIEPPSVFPRTR